MSILDSEYIKEQAHKPCFWSEEYGFDVVAFTHAMEQNYSNRVGSKINSLKKENEQLRQRVAELEKERDVLKQQRDELNRLCEFNEKTMGKLLKQRDELLKAAEAIEIDAEECLDFDECTAMLVPIDTYHKLVEAIASVKEKQNGN